MKSHCGMLGDFSSSALSGFVNFIPATPTYYSQFWLRRLRQHGKQLEHISIRVTEIERCSRHPSKHHRFVGRLAPKVERNNIGRAKKRCGVQQVREIRTKRNVKAQLLGPRPDLPQTKHRVASPTNPVKGDPPLPKHLREF